MGSVPANASPRFKAKLAGVFYLLTMLIGVFALEFTRGRLINNLLATACYIAVTLLFYDIFKPFSRTLSLLAAIGSFVGCAVGSLTSPGISLVPINSLVFFGFYCLLIGHLIFKSTFMPSFLGALMAFGGLGWLTFLSAPFARYLSPYNMFPGIIGEGVRIVFLLVKGLNAERWKERASVAS